VVPDEVSEGRGLGEEGLGGWRTKERDESGGTSQIPMDDGAAVLRRAMGTSTRGSGAFETGLSGMGQRGKKGGGVSMGTSMWWRSAMRGGRQWPPTIRHRQRCCHANKGGRRTMG
jgi:hypothetical protein